MKLHYFALSGHAHRAHLFLSLLGIDHELVHVDMVNGEHKSPEFLKLNPFGQVPVLEDGDLVIADSIAIMVYAAKKVGATNWLPEDAADLAQVQRWLSVAAGEIAYGPCAARLLTLFGAKFDANDVIARAHGVLKLIDDRLSNRDLIALDHPTAADIALYSYIANAPEGNVALDTYTHVLAWLKRIEALPGFVPFETSSVGLRAAS
ncbi:MAG: glutathione S-transferase [Thalassospira sp.]|uniref:glutathione S-transferase family protein n=1 Tax=Thalassospira sp. UBA4513 TaxID=1947675 RepID=UPI000C3B2E70|nr:glutathione S-transferase [Thalassospira sp. UBA4513]MBE70393.1 glutathione S-transferase [Thalassospira sp.]|tara:strand:- start:81 stop:698 length:618 start_codon:yes stop_codon:yes gene_type:complete